MFSKSDENDSVVDGRSSGFTCLSPSFTFSPSFFSPSCKSDMHELDTKEQYAIPSV